jgi:hypothetical protein
VRAWGALLLIEAGAFHAQGRLLGQSLHHDQVPGPPHVLAASRPQGQDTDHAPLGNLQGSDHP